MITKLMDGLPNQSMQQGEFDAAVAKYMAELPLRGAEENALAADVSAKQVTASAAATAAAESAVSAAAQVPLATAQANNAANSAVSAAAQVPLATAQANNAANSATDAEASRVAASKLNLGGKATAPTVDNQGAALLTGVTYYDTTLNKWRVWNGTAWTDGVSAVAGVESVNGATGPVTLKTINGIALTGAGNLAITNNLIRSARTANTALGVADNATLIDITSGTFTQTFAAAATLGNGWYCYLRNSGTGDIALDPNAAELIDGLTSYVMYPGEVRLVQCDGAAFTSIVVTPYRRDFTASGTWVKPPGYKVHGGLMWSGGSSGQRNNNGSTPSTGGGGGGCFPFTIMAEALGASETIIVGAGGAAVTAVAAGKAGGDTSLGLLLTVFSNTFFYNGGSVVKGLIAGTNAISAFGFEGGNGGTSPTYSINGIWGGGAAYDGAFDASGGSLYGGAAGGGCAAGGLKAAGTSKFGGNGGAASSTGNGTTGAAPGGGGGATQTGTQSGAGARGEVRIWGIV